MKGENMASPREELAKLLRQSRIDAGYESHGALAGKLNVSRSLISKAESASQPVPSPGLLTAWAGATGAPLDKLTERAKRAKSGTPEWFMPYQAEEARADTIRTWSPVQVPGLFQTESYARAVLGVEPYTPERLEDLVKARLERQCVIGRAYITAIIDEHVLHRPVGSAAVMAEQCDHLADVAVRSDIALHVIPEGVNMGLWGGFSLATRDNVTTACMTAIEDIPCEASRLTAKLTQAFERMLGAALPRIESRELIVKVAETKWKTQI
jgi:transcriptional regulator with XRE-family HTH domain